LVINELLLLYGQNFRILLGATKAWTSQANVVTLTKSPIRSYGESISSDRDQDLGAKLNVAPRITTNNWPDVVLIEADDAVRDTSAFRVEKDAL
jgi:hypothetical protein